MAASDQDQVHSQPCGTAIAVVERMDRYQEAMRIERNRRRIGRRTEPTREIPHQRRHLGRRGKAVAAGIGQHSESGLPQRNVPPLQAMARSSLR
jgi:hypothetical protein